ncbi:MAG: amidohydrolase family protein [Ruminococcus sp.]|nr:amidohydrolase family protein [Ruminococcus sp.]
MTAFDFHTHAFTDALAERAVAGLAETSGITPSTDGTVAGLRRMMKERSLSGTMVLPIATKPSQQKTINNWAAGIMGGGIYCCGTVHPDAEDIMEELERISALGLCGLKFHSEYQFFRPDEERMIPVYRRAGELGLFVVFHAGWDPYSRGEVLADPRSLANTAERCPDTTFIAAHMGGIHMADRVETELAGCFGNLYFDTAVIADYLSDEQFLRLIEKQGADRILFGSDIPWDDPARELAMIERAPLSTADKELITSGNAARLLSRFAR